MYNFTKSPIHSDHSGRLVLCDMEPIGVGGGVGHHRLARSRPTSGDIRQIQDGGHSAPESSMHRVSIGVRPTPDPTVIK